MKNKIAILFAAIVLLAIAVPAIAHNAFAAEYDENKPVKVTGVVTKVEWTNPHIWFYVDVKDDNGNITNWDLELMSPNTLTRAGWSKRALKAGDQVVVNAYMAKDGSKRGNARGSVTLADGRQIFAGNPERGENR